jgi:hypothetical protein
MEKLTRNISVNPSFLLPAAALAWGALTFAVTALAGLPLLFPNLALIVASLAVLLFLRPSLALYALLVLSIFENVLGYWFGSLYVGTWRDAITLGILALLAVKFVVSRRDFSARTPVTGLLLLLCGIIFLQIFNPGLPNVTMGVFGFRAYFIPMLGMLIGLNFIENKSQMKRIGIFILVLLSLAAVLGTIQSKMGFSSYENLSQYVRTDLTHHHSGYSWYRVSSIFGSVWEFGNLMAFMILLTIPVYVVVRKKELKVALFCAISILICGLIASAALSSIYGAVVGLVVFTFILKRRRLRFVVAAAVAVSLSAVLLERVGWERVLFYFASGTRHKTLWAPLPFHEALFANLSDCFFGKGMGIALDSVGTRFGFAKSYFQEMNPDRAMEGDYFKLMIQAGFPAMVLLLVIHVKAIVWGLRVRQFLTDPFLKCAAVGITIALCSGVVTSLFRTFIAQRPLDLFIWMSIGILFSLPRLEEKEIRLTHNEKPPRTQPYGMARRSGNLPPRLP